MSPSLNSQVVSLSEVPVEQKSAFNRKADRPSILVVDDERVIADTLSIILSRSGFTTFTAYNGEAALEMAQTVRPHLLISDVVMPGMTGVELAIALSLTLPSCGVVLFSGQAATADLLSEARELGHDFITLSKPVHPTDMLEQVNRSLKSTKYAAPSSVSPAYIPETAQAWT